MLQVAKSDAANARLSRDASKVLLGTPGCVSHMDSSDVSMWEKRCG